MNLNQIKIGVMVCTRQRPKMLEECARSVLKQLSSVSNGDFLVIIENDSEEKTKHVVDRLQKQFPSVPLYYVLESDLGIPIARNRGMEVALEKGANWLAFIDDDETLEPGWLEAMRRAAVDLDADAIIGPVRYLFTYGRPDWLSMPSLKNYPRGREMKTAATNNTLLSAQWLAAQAEPFRFDEAFRFTGGSDSDFFFRLTDAGGTIRWVDDAIVQEEVTADRITMQWQISRAQRTAANAMQIAIKRKGANAWVSLVPKTVGRALRGLLLSLAGAFVKPVSSQRSVALNFEGRKALATALGHVQGALRKAPEPYKTVSGH